MKETSYMDSTSKFSQQLSKFRFGPLKNAKGLLHSLQGLQGSYYKEAKHYSQELAYHSLQA
jgi:hypothetical protein